MIFNVVTAKAFSLHDVTYYMYTELFFKLIINKYFLVHILSAHAITFASYLGFDFCKGKHLLIQHVMCINALKHYPQFITKSSSLQFPLISTLIRHDSLNFVCEQHKRSCSIVITDDSASMHCQTCLTHTAALTTTPSAFIIPFLSSSRVQQWLVSCKSTSTHCQFYLTFSASQHTIRSTNNAQLPIVYKSSILSGQS